MAGTESRMLRLTAEQDRVLTSARSGDSGAVDQLHATLAAHAVELSAEVLSVKRVGAGAGVSYGHTHVTGAPTTLALVYLGYGHGLPRKAGNRAVVTWHAPDGVVRTMPIVGRVAMDVLVVDAGDSPVRAGDRVVVFGDPEAGDIPLDRWSQTVGETPATVLCPLDHRVVRVVSE